MTNKSAKTKITKPVQRITIGKNVKVTELTSKNAGSMIKKVTSGATAGTASALLVSCDLRYCCWYKTKCIPKTLCPVC